MTKPDATPPAPAKPGRRRRGPNKPKPGAIEVRTEAVMSQAEIVKLLAAHATEQLGAPAAAGMELQVNTGDGWRSLADAGPPAIGILVRFATSSRSP